MWQVAICSRRHSTTVFMQPFRFRYGWWWQKERIDTQYKLQTTNRQIKKSTEKNWGYCFIFIALTPSLQLKMYRLREKWHQFEAVIWQLDALFLAPTHSIIKAFVTLLISLSKQRHFAAPQSLYTVNLTGTELSRSTPIFIHFHWHWLNGLCRLVSSFLFKFRSKPHEMATFSVTALPHLLHLTHLPEMLLYLVSKLRHFSLIIAAAVFSTS